MSDSYPYGPSSITYPYPNCILCGRLPSPTTSAACTCTPPPAPPPRPVNSGPNPHVGYNKLQPRHMPPIADAVAKNSKLQTLDLSGNGLGDDGVATLATGC